MWNWALPRVGAPRAAISVTLQPIGGALLGVTLLRANNLSLSVRYELQAASGFISQTGIVRLQQRF